MFVTYAKAFLMGDAAKRSQSIFPSADHDQGVKFLKKLWCCVGGSIAR